MDILIQFFLNLQKTRDTDKLRISKGCGLCVYNIWQLLKCRPDGTPILYLRHLPDGTVASDLQPSTVKRKYKQLQC